MYIYKRLVLKKIVESKIECSYCKEINYYQYLRRSISMFQLVICFACYFGSNVFGYIILRNTSTFNSCLEIRLAFLFLSVPNLISHKINLQHVGYIYITAFEKCFEWEKACHKSRFSKLSIRRVAAMRNVFVIVQ